MNFRDPAKRRPEASLDITPLIDIVFLLLVFFLLTTTFAQPTPSEQSTTESESIIDIQLAEGQSGQAAAPAEKITVFLDDQGMIFLDSDTPIPPNELKAALLEMVKDGETPNVDLKADKKASHGAVIELLDLIKGTGIEQVNIVIQKSE